MNSDVIRLLPDSVANQIAAGEVIQRPASVIKELVENSIDAGATAITIILKDAGRTLIQVVDNGCGMSPTDARMAFERHATSKISAAADLYSLHTMGFRGEALPSIAAVAQIDLRTMRAGDSVGTRLLISESKFESQEPATCVPGTNIMVKNIFFHMPARRKFLKKDSIELSHILREFERLALVNTNVEFTLIHNDVTLHQFPASTLKQRIGALFGKNVESQIAPISTETSLVKISGFIGMPRFAKKRGAQQYFFVNGRNMRHMFFHKAVLKCYEQLVAPDMQPLYFINFEVDPSTIDVNIHPQKHEIKFEHEAAIWQILEAAVREALGKTQAVGALDFSTDDTPEIPLYNPATAIGTPDEDFDENYNPFKSAPNNRSGEYGWRQSEAKRVPQDWEKLYENFNSRRNDTYPSADSGRASVENTLFGSPQSIFATNEISTGAPACFQLRSEYIVSATNTGILVISQRRAHIRILYEKYMEMLKKEEMPSQALIFAEELELSPSQSIVLESLTDRLTQMGFSLSKTEAAKWSITAVPSPLVSVSPASVLINIVEDFAAGDDKVDIDLYVPLALSMARGAAVKSNQQLTVAEMESIVADLFRCAEPSYTPEGLPVMTTIENDELQSRLSL
ncbi:MAG: DNA mismatch repair endonuclease MutL [Muribaculaceae bacterium]|nr:DNA mismatch repair endonuclease MutL [Muribaculaceae bacterium]